MTTLQPPHVALLERYGATRFHGTTFQPRYSAHANVNGEPAGGSHPEQLFAAGYAACFHGVLHLLASRAAIAVPNLTVDVTVTFGRDPVDGLFMLAAAVEIHLPGVALAVAEELVRNAERVCPYSKMTRQGIPNVTVAVQAPSTRA